MRALAVAIDSISKIIFEFVAGIEKFGIESKASLKKSSNASTDAKHFNSVKTLEFDRSFKNVS